MRGFLSSRAAAVVVALVSSVAVAACGGSSKSSTSSSATTTVSSSSTSTGAGTQSTSTSTTEATTSASQTSTAASLWSLPNADPDGTRDVSSQISSSNVSELKVAWKIPITGIKGLYGVFASSPVFGPNGVVYLQDLGDNVFAVNDKTGKVMWTYKVPKSDTNGEGPNGVTLVDNRIYGNTNTSAFALQASTGEQLWKRSGLAAATGAKFNGQGINIAPQVVDGKVFLSDSGEAHGGIAYALDAKTGEDRLEIPGDQGPGAAQPRRPDRYRRRVGHPGSRERHGVHGHRQPVPVDR